MCIECSIRIDRVRTRNVKVSNWIEYALSQSTSVCGLNPVRSGLEWNVGGRSLCHMTEVCTRIRVRSVRGMQLIAAGWNFAETKALLGIWGDADVQNQLDGIERNKAISQKVATAIAALGYSRTWLQCRVKVKNLVQRYKEVSLLASSHKLFPLAHLFLPQKI